MPLLNPDLRLQSLFRTSDLLMAEFNLTSQVIYEQLTEETEYPWIYSKHSSLLQFALGSDGP